MPNGGSGDDLLIGTDGADVILGGDGNDTIDGKGGDDQLNGQNGADYIVGGSGNDQLYGEAGDDLIGAQDGNDIIDGGDGNDRLYGDAGADYIVAGTGNDQAYGQDGDDLIGGQDGDDFIDGGSGQDLLYGDAGLDHILGGDGTDQLYGQAGNDRLEGGNGDDLLDGGADDDRLFGGNGFDHLVGGSGNDQLGGEANDDLLEGGDGNDTIDGGIGVDQLFGGAGADYLVGGDGGDLINGGDGDDIAGGEGGDDQIDGGAGADHLYGDAGFDHIVGGAGNDVIYGQGDDDVIGGDDGDDSIDGGDGGDRLFGDAGNDQIMGGAGNDLLYGQAGNDVADGGDGDDLIDGGDGDDQLFGGLGADYIVGGIGADTVAAGAGNDIVGGQDGNDILDGGDGDDQLYGDAGADYIVGGTGNDQLFGQAGDDIIGGQDSNDSIDGGDGADSLYGDAGSDQILGGTGNDLLYGQAGDDTLNGGDGNDQIDGGIGKDVMTGGLGDDVYFVDDAADTVVESAGQGVDTINSTINYTLAAGVEIETLAVSDPNSTIGLSLTGNAFNQTIRGAAGADVLNGGGGSDTLVGGDGSDTYVVDSDDNVIEGGPGHGVLDKVLATASFTLAAGQGVEILAVLDPLSQAAINLTGNDLTQEIRGGAGNNVLTGSAAGVSFFGGLGADTLDSSGRINCRYYFDTALGNGNIDFITNLGSGGTIMLAGDAGGPFSMFATGQVAANMFVVGAAAGDANDFLIYNPTSGALLYDADGSGAGAAVQFATLQTNLTGLNSGMFQVFGAPNHAPTINSAATVSVDENVPPTTIVYQTVAADSDGDRIFYSLSGADANQLTIDVNGAVRLVSFPDYETKSTYSFTVVASDSVASTSKAVTLTVNNLPDSSTTPVINETASANDSVPQAQTADRNIFNVSANGELPNQALPSASIHGNVSTNNDVDFYSIHLEAGEQIVLDIDHTTNSLDSFIRFYDSGGNEIVNNDDKISADQGSNPPFDHNTDSYLTYRVATAGTYYFSVESFGDLNDDGDDDGPTVGESNGNYSLNVSIGPPATAAQIMDEDIDALISGEQWNHLALTYGFPTSTSGYPSGIKEITPASDFSPFTAAQQAATVQLLQLVANVSSLTFQQQSGANAGTADIRYAMSDEADVAYAYYPTNGGPNSVGGTAWFNKDDFNNPVRGNYAWMGILHETGHTLGLKHGHEAPAVSFDHDSVEYTVMTYRSYPGDDLNGYQNEQWGYPQSLMMLDIAALQRIYGANFGFNSGNSVYSWSPTTGEMSINGVGQGGANNGAGGSANRVFLTIWDGGGDDTYDMSNYSTSVTVDLRPGEWSNLNSAQRASLGNGHFARGNVANALMFEGNSASLIENAKGGSADDGLIANQVANHLTGNGGSDNFKWMAVTDSSPGALADTIMDFVRGSDRIDLSGIDANPNSPGMQGFHLLGTAAFSHTAGELRYDVTGGNAHVFADVDGNGVADMEIIVNNVTVLAGTDFQGVTSSDVFAPTDLGGNAAADVGAVAESVTAPAATDVLRATFGHDDLVADLGAHGPAHLAMHHLAALAGPEFYF